MKNATRRPHIFLFYADDWGWSNVGYHRPGDTSGEVATPSIDTLAAAGVRLERMYAYSFCAPSRASLMSGRLPYHSSLQNIRGTVYNEKHPEVGGEGVPRNMTMLPQRLRDLGYLCHFAGKWDVGFATAGHTPNGRGYHTSLAYFYQVNDYWTQGLSGSEGAACNHKATTPPAQFRDLWRDTGPARAENGTAYEEALFEGELMRVLRQYEEDYLLAPQARQREERGRGDDNSEQQQQQPQQRRAPPPPPLFLHYAPHLVHSPYQVPQEWLDRFAFIAQRNDTSKGLRQVYAAMVSYMDSVVGNVTGEMRRLGLWENTLMLSMSDNGGPIQGGQGANNAPLRGGKLTFWEGGVRVNAFASGGYLPQSVRGSQYHGMLHVADVFATLAEAAGDTAPTADPIAAAAGLPPIDSLSFLGVLTRKIGAPTPRTELLLSSSTFYSGPYKLATGKLSLAVWQGLFYPNASTDSGAEQKTTVDCNSRPGGACLWDVDADPTEHHELVESDPHKWHGRVQQMKARSAALWKTRFEVDRGKQDDRGCQAIDANGGFFGPWVP